MRLFSEKPTNKDVTLVPTVQLQQETLADYRRLGILPLYERLFMELEKTANKVKEQLIEEGMEEWKAEAISQQSRQKAEVDAIRQVQEAYIKALQKEGNKAPASSSSTHSL